MHGIQCTLHRDGKEDLGVREGSKAVEIPEDWVWGVAYP